MTPKQIANINIPISPFALGTAFYRVDTAEDHFTVLDAYLESNGTIIDSARSYGQSEEVLGRWFKVRPDVRARLLLITKCGHGPELKLPEAGFSELVHAELEKSLATLHTDYIDLYLLHRDNQEMRVSAILEPLNEAISNGRIRAIGASNWEYRRVIEANAYAEEHGMAGFSVVSNTTSLARPAAAFYTGLVHTDPIGEKWHEETGIPLIPWSSQSRGFFTGTWTQAMRDDPAIAHPETPTFDSRMLKVYGTDDNFERLHRARELGEQKGDYTPMEIGLAWLLHRPFPVIPIVGPRTPDELVSCVRAADLALTDEECRWLDLG